ISISLTLSRGSPTVLQLIKSWAYEEGLFSACSPGPVCAKCFMSPPGPNPEAYCSVTLGFRKQKQGFGHLVCYSGLQSPVALAIGNFFQPWLPPAVSGSNKKQL
ncbi:hypothetical protein HispidOSU_025069, partial [Sigmodon hispidus]